MNATETGYPLSGLHCISVQHTFIYIRLKLVHLVSHFHEIFTEIHPTRFRLPEAAVKFLYTKYSQPSLGMV
jgi:hypothetical protein